MQNSAVSNTLNRATQDTSIQAFYSLANVTKQQRMILTALESGPACDKQIAARLNLEINVVCARRNELYHDNKIEIAHKGASPYTGRTVCFWRIKQKGQQKLI